MIKKWAHQISKNKVWMLNPSQTSSRMRKERNQKSYDGMEEQNKDTRKQRGRKMSDGHPASKHRK